MIKSIEEYLDLLKAELNGSDAATIQDALADAEEHLRAAFTSLREKQAEIPEEEALRQIIEQYGSPEETASAYKEVERRTSPQLASELPKNTSPLSNFFGVYTDARAWGALLYMLIAFVTGIFISLGPSQACRCLFPSPSLSLACQLLCFFCFLFMDWHCWRAASWRRCWESVCPVDRFSQPGD